MTYYSRFLDDLRARNLLRTMRTIAGAAGPVVSCEGREKILFSSNDYLGLASHPEIARQAIAAAASFGTGSGASRLISGSNLLHGKLEIQTALFKQTEACLVFNSGYQANTGIIPAIAPQESVIFSDELNHASLIDGMRLSRAKVRVYPHRDMYALRRALDEESNGHEIKWIITDTIFSMDGDVAPVGEIVALASAYGAYIMLDEAHATGVRGPAGRGIAHEAGVAEKITLQMGTFSKALGSFGAYAAGSRQIIDYLLNTSRGFIFSTSLPPAVIAASLAALEIAGRGDSLRIQLKTNARILNEELSKQGWNVPPVESHIIPVIIGDAGVALKISDRLFELGIWAHGIRPPTVPAGTSRIRLTPTAAHTESHIQKGIEAFGMVRREFSDYLL